MASKHVEKTMKLIDILQPMNFRNLKFQEFPQNEGQQLEIENGKSKQYFFSITMDKRCQFLSVGAHLRSEPKRYFWYNLFEIVSLEKDMEEIHIYLKEFLLTIDAKQTRIRQTKSWLNIKFELEYENEPGEWELFGSIRALRTNIAFPKIADRTKTYY